MAAARRFPPPWAMNGRTSAAKPLDDDVLAAVHTALNHLGAALRARRRGGLACYSVPTHTARTSAYSTGPIQAHSQRLALASRLGPIFCRARAVEPSLIMQVPEMGLDFGGQPDCQTVLFVPSRGTPTEPANWLSVLECNTIFPIGLS
jgi:hypothetical protein